MGTTSSAVQPIGSALGQAEREHSTAPLEGILDAVPVPVVVAEADGFATQVNTAWCRASGRSREESTGFGWLEAVESADRCRLLAAAPWVAAGHGAAPADREAPYEEPYEELDVMLAGRSTWWRLSRHGPSHVLMVALESTTAAEIASWLIPDLFAVGLGLVSVTRLAPPAPRERMLEAIDRLDEIGLKVRRAL
jgi:PAS domain-containing protein